MRIVVLLAGAAVACGLLAVSPAAAATELVRNGGFEQSTATTKTSFNRAGVASWNVLRGNNLNNDAANGLTYLDTPGTADNGSYLSVYGPFPKTSPVGGNFVQMDAEPNYSTLLFQEITGLTTGASYDLTFWQAAGQQAGFTGPTTERWIVSFGNGTSAGTTSKLSDEYQLPQGGVGPWQKQNMSFTANAATQYLSFLASGTPNGKPPVAFLDGVSMTAAVPEPGTWATMLAGFGAIGLASRRRRPAAAA